MPRCTLAGCLCLVLFASHVEAGRVELIIANQGASPFEVQRWAELLKSLRPDGFQIRTAQPGDRVEVVSTPIAGDVQHRVTGMLTRQGELLLPDGRFSNRDSAGLGRWLARWRSAGSGASASSNDPAAGFTAAERAQVRKALSVPHDASTAGTALRALVDRAAEKLSLPLTADRAVLDALNGAEPIRDELQGVSFGTALAAALRPEGLVLAPRRTTRGTIELLIVKPAAGLEHWPVGWPPDAEKPERLLLPEMYEFVNVELDNVPLGDLVTAIGTRLKTPVLYDHNALARQNIDPQETRVSFPAGKSAYSIVLGRMLIKARLKYEVRVDDAGQPLLWIYTLL